MSVQLHVASPTVGESLPQSGAGDPWLRGLPARWGRWRPVV